MKKCLLIISLIICALTTAKAQYYSVNFDKETVAKMVASFNTEAATEMYYADQIAKILDRPWTLDKQHRELLLSTYLSHGFG